jgi:hypothetical protein
MTSLGDKPDTSRSGLNRALPGWAVDAIRNGIPNAHYSEIYGALVSIAMSAHVRGWDENDYVTLVSNTFLNGQLWVQMRVGHNGKARRSDRSARKELGKAWNQAATNIATGRAAYTAEEVRREAVRLAVGWVDRLMGDRDDLSPDQRAVMTYVVGETQRRGMLRVTCPTRDVGEFAKIPRMSAHRVLNALTEKGLLVKHSAGRRSGPYGGGRAAIYGLSEPGRLGEPSQWDIVNTRRFTYVPNLTGVNSMGGAS